MLSRGEKVKLVRLLFRVSQSLLSIKAGIKNTVLNKLEQGKYTPPVSVFEKLSVAADVNLKWFLQDVGSIFRPKLTFILLSGEEATRGSRFQKDLLNISYIETISCHLFKKQNIESCCFLYSNERCYIICESGYDISKGYGLLNEDCQYLVIKADRYLAGMVMNFAQNMHIKLYPIEDKKRVKGSAISISEELDNFYSKPPSKQLIKNLRVALERYLSLFNEENMILANTVLISFYHDLFDVSMELIKESDILSPATFSFEDKAIKIVQYAKSINASPKDMKKALNLIK